MMRPSILIWRMAFLVLHVKLSTSLARDVTKLVRVYVADSLQLHAPYQIDEKNCHYITSVMRLKVGSSFRIFNGRDGEFTCDLESISKNKKSALGMIRKQIRFQEEDRQLPLVLYCAPLKKPRMKLLLEKVTELGVRDIVLVKTQNANADYEDIESLASLERVCIESAEQCERLSIPRVMKSISIQELSNHWSMLTNGATVARKPSSGPTLSRLLVCRERFPGGEPLLQTLLAASSIDLKSEIDKEASLASSEYELNRHPIGVFIGPEGGFTATEIESMAALSKIFHFVTLGDSVLRAETAAISAVSTVGAAIDYLTYRNR